MNTSSISNIKGACFNVGAGSRVNSDKKKKSRSKETPCRRGWTVSIFNSKGRKIIGPCGNLELEVQTKKPTTVFLTDARTGEVKFSMQLTFDSEVKYVRKTKEIEFDAPIGVYLGKEVARWRTCVIKAGDDTSVLDIFYGKIAEVVLYYSTWKLSFVKHDIPDLTKKVRQSLRAVFGTCCRADFAVERRELAIEYTRKIGVVGLSSVLANFEEEMTGMEGAFHDKDTLLEILKSFKTLGYEFHPGRNPTNVKYVTMILKGHLLENGFPDDNTH